MLHISFGILVLNGQPFIRYNLRSLYPWAHQIIVSEGACRSAKAIAREDGHSRDGTLEEIQRFQAEEDPARKVVLVSARDEGFDDGFWPEKTEMCQGFSRRATGNCLWQIDSDEFYRERDMPRIAKLLEDGVAAAILPQYSFWGGVDYVNDGMALREFDLRGSGVRVFRWGPGYRYMEHRPPTVVDASGASLRFGKVADYWTCRRMGLYRYHYCLVFPSQVFTKVNYYRVHTPEKDEQGGGYAPEISSWHEKNYMRITNPYAMHNIAGSTSWVQRFEGEHPAQVIAMMQDIKQGKIAADLRVNTDVEALLRSRRYRFTTALLGLRVAVSSTRMGYQAYRAIRAAKNRVRRLVSR